MATITFTIPEEKVDRVLDAIAGKHPIPINKETGEPEFTKGQWAKEYIRRLIVRTVYAWEKDSAAGAVEKDDSIAT